MVNREKFVHRETVVVSSEQLLPDCQGKDVIATRTASLDSGLPFSRAFLCHPCAKVCKSICACIHHRRFRTLLFDRALFQSKCFRPTHRYSHRLDHPPQGKEYLRHTKGYEYVSAMIVSIQHTDRFLASPCAKFCQF